MLILLITIAIVFLVLSLIAGMFGFKGVARTGYLVSRIIFFYYTYSIASYNIAEDILKSVDGILMDMKTEDIKIME